MIIPVKSIMKSPVITALPEESLARAAARMEEHGIGRLPVLHEGKLVGILSSRDMRRSHPNRLVADAMSINLVTIRKDAPIWEALQIMKERQLESLPVMDDSELVGIITKADLLVEMGKYTDPLTGLQTAEYIRFIGETLLNEGTEITVLFFDLNDFGLFNKKYGHVIGDHCLTILGHILKNLVIRETDHLCRYGGDEFVVITTRLKDNVMDWTQNAINAIKKELQEQNLHVEASVGLSSGQGQDMITNLASTILDELINSASLASTRAKEKGSLLMIAG